MLRGEACCGMAEDVPHCLQGVAGLSDEQNYQCTDPGELLQGEDPTYPRTPDADARTADCCAAVNHTRHGPT